MQNPHLNPLFRSILNSMKPTNRTDQQKFARMAAKSLDKDKPEPVDAYNTDMNPITMWCCQRDIMKKVELINWN